MPKLEYYDPPKSYDQMYNNMNVSLPNQYYNEGLERYRKGSEEYMVHVGDDIMVNHCFLKSTDTIKDIEEELIDAFFNCMVGYWKYKDERYKILGSIIGTSLTGCLRLRLESN